MSWGKRLVPGGCVSGGLFLEDICIYIYIIHILYIYIWVASSYNMNGFVGWLFFTFCPGKSPLFQRHLGEYVSDFFQALFPSKSK